MPNYLDDWKGNIFTCGKCKWEGKGSELADGEVFSYLQELDCPKCHERVTSLVFPTLDDLQENRSKLSKEDLRWTEKLEKVKAEFESSCLRNGDQLPDIEEKSFELKWDYLETGDVWETQIKLGDRVIFTERTVYEGAGRFAVVAQILRDRYGPALVDLVPTQLSEFMLYGDDLSASDKVAASRKRIFGR